LSTNVSIGFELRERACPVCGSTDEHREFAASTVDFSTLDQFAFASRKLPEYMHFRLIECGRCEVLYANPIPPLEMLALAYRDAGFDSTVESQHAARTYSALLKRQLRSRGRALDIGAGDGAFLAALLDLGFSDVVGIEPSSAPIEAAPERVREFIRQTLFSADDFAPNSFDLVTSFQTIEHVYDPAALVRGIARVLKPGGTAFLIFHDSRALSAKLLKTKSPIFDVEHLQLFSAASADYLMRSLEFTDIRIGPIWNSYPLRYWCKLFPFPAAQKKRILGFMNASPIGSFNLAVPAGNLAAFGIKH
jgi:SAM-dependent methyltransferase